jgi:hypothetical protein
MKIATVDQRHIYGSTLQFLGGIQPGESATQNHNPLPRYHDQHPFLSNLAAGCTISVREMALSLIPLCRKSVLCFRALGVALLFLFTVVNARADSPASKRAETSAITVASEPVRAPADASPTIVIGFLGGFVRHNDAVHSTVQVARDLQKAYPAAVRIETFENRRASDAHALILHDLGADRQGGLTSEQKRAARIILYGHSWGASAVVALARSLKADGIPVILTVQVDSVAKSGQNDAVIPDNVKYAANFYQDKGFIHGQQKIVAADASHTQILGNFYVDYSAHPIACPEYPWYTRVFMRSHIEIECDQHVWQRVENLIREQLSIASAAGRPTP